MKLNKSENHQSKIMLLIIFNVESSNYVFMLPVLLFVSHKPLYSRWIYPVSVTVFLLLLLLILKTIDIKYRQLPKSLILGRKQEVNDCYLTYNNLFMCIIISSQNYVCKLEKNQSTQEVYIAILVVLWNHCVILSKEFIPCILSVVL